MSPDQIERIRMMHRRYYHQSINVLPDGWYKIVDDFLHLISSIADLTDGVSVRFERTPSGLKAFAFPEMSRWHPEQDIALRVAQRTLYGLSQQTCEVCGLPAVLEGNRIRCAEHAAVEPQVSQSQALYQEVRDLFPPVHGNSINLDLPDFLHDLVANTFRSILKLVIREGVVGKVLITRVEVDDDALFVRVRYQNLTAVFMGTQMAINEMISDLEVLSDEATRKQNSGGSDAAS